MLPRFFSRTGSQRSRAAFGAVIIAMAVAGSLPSELRASETNVVPAPENPVAVFQSTTLARASQWRRGTLDVASTRTLQQRLRLDTASPNGRVAIAVELRHRFDQGLPADPTDPLLAERQLDPSLESAQLRWRPIAPLQLTAGRLRSRALHGERVDGAELIVSPHRSVSATIGVGMRPTRETSTLDGDSLDRGNARELENAAPSALVSGARVTYERPGGGVSLGFIDERQPARQVVLRRRITVAARAGMSEVTHGRLEAVIDGVALRPEDLRATVLLALPERRYLTLQAKHHHPTFALDSIFSVFDSAPSSSLHVGLAFRHGRWDADIRSGLRTWWPESVATADVILRHEGQRSRSSCSLSGEVGATRQLGRLSGSARIFLSRVVSLEPLVALALARDAASRHNEPIGSARTGSTLHIRIGDWGQASARIDGGYDSLVRLSVAANLGLDLTLPAYRRSARRLLERDTARVPADGGG
jgi:hypothetical protein